MVSKDTRIKGNKVITFTGAGIDRAQELKSLTIENDDASGDPTFVEAAAGQGKDYTVKGTFKQDTAADSLLRWIYANEGAIVQCRYAPHGNAIADIDHPHWLFSAQVAAIGTIGGDADYDGTEADSDFEWKITTGKPTLDDGSDAKASVQSAQPASGVTSGNTLVLSGYRFSGATAVKFGTTSVTPVVLNDGAIAVTVPNAASGATNITVVTPAGTSAAFSYTVAS